MPTLESHEIKSREDAVRELRRILGLHTDATDEEVLVAMHKFHVVLQEFLASIEKKPLSDQQESKADTIAMVLDDMKATMEKVDIAIKQRLRELLDFNAK